MSACCTVLLLSTSIVRRGITTPRLAHTNPLSPPPLTSEIVKRCEYIAP